MKKKKRKIYRRKKGDSRSKGKDKNLTYRQERFVNEYIKSYNGREAVIQAGYSHKGAHVRASELLKMDKIKKAIEEKQKKIADKCEITREKVLKDLEFTRLKSIEKNRFAPAHKCSELQGRSIAMFTDKQLMGEDKENFFGAEKIKRIEESLLRKLERLAGERSPIIDVEPVEEQKMIPFKNKGRMLLHKRKRYAGRKRKVFSEPEPEEELNFDDPEFDYDDDEPYVPMPNNHRKVSFADFSDLSEEAMEKRIRNDDWI